jgi:hypothetical protein
LPPSKSGLSVPAKVLVVADELATENPMTKSSGFALPLASAKRT